MDAPKKNATNGNHPTDDLRLQPGARFDCVTDGSCCRDFVEFRVDAPAAERILSADWRACSDLPEREESPFYKPKKKGGDARLLKTRENRCGFLGEDDLCRLHKKYGAETKPLNCRAYPFRFVRTPGGIYVGMSFTCTSVLQDSGRPLESHGEELRRLAAEDFLQDEVTDPIRLDSSLALGWDQYLAVEKALDEILAAERDTVETCLIAGHAWLGMLRKMLGAADAADPGAIDKILEFYIQRTREDGFSQSLKIARRQVGQRAVKRMLLGSFISFRNTLRPNQWRLTAIARLLFQFLRHLTRLGALRLDPLKNRVPYARFRPEPEDLAAPETQALLRRYFRHALFRKDLVHHTDLFRGYCYFVMVYGLTQWYNAALKAQGEPDPAAALALVERHYVLHPDFNQTFLYHPAMADVLQHLFQKPHFAHTIVRG